MSDGIELKSPCCDSLALKKEYEELKVWFKHPLEESKFYDSSIPVYTCYKCGGKWAIESVFKRK